MKNRTKKITIVLAAFALLASAVAPAWAFGPANPGPGEQKIEDITKSVAPSVVRVEARNGTRKVATGVVIDKDGYIVTTALISPRDEEISVLTTDGKRLKAEFKGLDTQTHLALLQVKEKGLAPIALGKAGDLKPGAWIGVIGLSPENTAAVTQGIVSSVTADKLRLNVWVVPGMSGSPVVNGSGQMVGLLRGAYTDEQPFVFEFREQQIVGSGTVFSRAEAPSSGMALAIPVDIVQSVASDLEKTGKVERGWLGVQAGERADGKVEIGAVEPKSPAELAKIKEGDVILKIDGKDIASGEALQTEIRSRKPGQDITVKIERDGKSQDIKVKLGEYTEIEARKDLALAFPQLFPQKAPAPPYGGALQKEPKILVAPKSKSGLRPFAWFSRKFIGVTLQELNKDSVGVLFGIKDGAALLIAEITPDGPAAKAGLKVGDIVLKADGKRLQAAGELSDLIQQKKKGDKVKIEFMREKKTMTLEVEVSEEESGEASDLMRQFGTPYPIPEWGKKSQESDTIQLDEFYRQSDEVFKKLQDEFKKKTTLRRDSGKVVRVLDGWGVIS